MWFKKFGFFMDYFLALILVESHLWSSAVSQSHPGFTLDTSVDVKVQQGLCAHAPCSFTVPSDLRLSINTIGKWLKEYNTYPPAPKNNLNPPTNGHFFLTGNVASGDCSYYIEPRSTDKGKYFFRFEDGDLKFNYKSFKLKMDIIALTDKPTISSTRLVDGEEVTLTCTSPGRCRNIKPLISWEGTMTGIRQSVYNTTYEDGSRSFHSNITFTPRKADNKSPLFCKVTLKEDATTKEKQTLNVEYSPSMNITIEGVDTTTVIVKDGDSITLTCIVDSNPNASITWYKGNMVVNGTIGDQTVTLKLINITLNDTGVFQCSAKNEHGVTHRTVQILYQRTKSQVSTVMAAAVGGVILLVLMIVIGAVLVTYFKKKRQHGINGNLKDMSMDVTDAIYCYPEFTIPDVNPSGKTLQKENQSSAGEDSVYMNPEDVQYANIEFSKLKHKVAPKDMETEYSEIKKTQCN